MTPTLSTTCLVLRPMLKPSTRQIAWLRNPEVVRFSEQRHQTHTLSSELRWINSFENGSHLWAIWTASGEHIGTLSATFDRPNNVADVGIMIGETKFWGKGLGREAWTAATNWLLSREGGVRKLEAGCMKTNLAMAKIIQGAGFKLEGERLNHFLLDGSPISELMFGRFK